MAYNKNYKNIITKSFLVFDITSACTIRFVLIDPKVKFGMLISLWNCNGCITVECPHEKTIVTIICIHVL